ncbi:hypothetical protein CJD36_017080 [Flavipsychrobacter stenotrophus]|uniref:Uncharacterized protein n=1 Tax=Flavipsychrobacter stenotrophus TaxID=2077091 RepID=A0A2S7SRW4_9BACT|nr:hypothetical protein [Flavipsychrobacter stenotrophus]PQJ09649.1 hypothetical protein CJD36_017080 [Flavipsychrobacter stenotrophus]
MKKHYKNKPTSKISATEQKFSFRKTACPALHAGAARVGLCAVARFFRSPFFYYFSFGEAKKSKETLGT